MPLRFLFLLVRREWFDIKGVIYLVLVHGEQHVEVYGLAWPGIPYLRDTRAVDWSMSVPFGPRVPRSMIAIVKLSRGCGGKLHIVVVLYLYCSV